MYSSCQPCRTLHCHTEVVDGLVTRSCSMSSITPRSRFPPVKHPRIWTPMSPATTRLEMISMPGTGASTIVKRWMDITLAYKSWDAGSKRRRYSERPNSSSVYWALHEEQVQAIDSYALAHTRRQISLSMSFPDKAITEHSFYQRSSCGSRRVTVSCT